MTQEQLDSKCSWARQLIDQAEKAGVPEHMVGGFVAYIVNRRPMGDFGTAVLENNLMEAMGQADSTNRAALFQITGFIYNHAPADCWGSKDKVHAWLKGDA